MLNLITLPLLFNGNEYFLLVQISSSGDYEDFHVTTITGELQAKMYVNYIFRWDGNNYSIIKSPVDKPATIELAEKIWHTIYTTIIVNKEKSTKDV
jgi:hypothetical protein